jgi:hypothetical protein
MDPEAPRRRAEELENELELRKMEANSPKPWLEFGCAGIILLILFFFIRS